jgi:hypothetical protein
MRTIEARYVKSGKMLRISAPPKIAEDDDQYADFFKLLFAAKVRNLGFDDETGDGVLSFGHFGDIYLRLVRGDIYVSINDRTMQENCRYTNGRSAAEAIVALLTWYKKYSR